MNHIFASIPRATKGVFKSIELKKIRKKLIIELNAMERS